MSVQRVLVLGLALLAIAGCGPHDEATPAAVVTPRPFLTAQPEGGFLLRDAAGAEPERTLCANLHAVRAPAVDWQATSVCFLGQAEKDAPWRLYRCAPAAGAQAEAVRGVVDVDSAPAWLPDGRIVVSAPAGDASRALFVLAADAAAERITFSGTDAMDPCVLRDGRILYAGLRTTPEGTRAPALFTVHPDGVGMLLFHGATPGTRYARPRQGPDGNVVFLVDGADGTRAWVADWRAPSEAATPLDVPAGVTGVEPDGAGAWLALGHDGALHAVGGPSSPGWTSVHVFASAAAAARPQGHMSMVQSDAATGSLMCMDAGRGVDGPAAAFARFFARVLQPDAGAYDWQELGRVALEADGSFYATVPADTPLRLDVLGADGDLLRTSRTPFWVRPGEVRGCTGCHDAPDTTPPNRQPAAVRADPVLPKLAKEGS